MCDLSIIIVSWNTEKLVSECVTSIKQNTKDITYEIIVVDNNSQDDTVNKLEFLHKDIKIIVNNSNNGFAKANNQAIKIAKGRNIILLNPDTLLKNNALKLMVNYLDTHSEVGIVGCKLLNSDGSLQESCRRFPDIKTYINILLKQHIFFPNKKCFRNYFMKNMNYDIVNEVDQVMGAALMFRRDVLGEKTYLDEEYWIWFEEVDFCYNVKKNGYKIMYIPDAKVMHYKAQSFNQLMKLRQQKIFNNSLLIYFDKNGKNSDIIKLKIIFPIAMFLSFLLQILNIFKKRG